MSQLSINDTETVTPTATSLVMIPQDKSIIHIGKIITFIVSAGLVAFLVFLAAIALRTWTAPLRTPVKQPEDDKQKPITVAIEATKTMVVDQTVVSHDQELCVPAFLEYQSDKGYERLKFLTKGGGGSIYFGRALAKDLRKKTKEQKCRFIVKQLEQPSDENDRQELFKAFLQEIAVMWFFRLNPNIAHLVGYSLNPWSILMIHYPFGSLNNYLHEPNSSPLAQQSPWTLDNIRWLMTDVASALQALHGNGFVHCDIKPANILLSWHKQLNRPMAVLTDFGITRVVSSGALLVRGFRTNGVVGASLLYAAPEVIKYITHTEEEDLRNEQELKAGDIFAFAIVLYEALTRRSPWSVVD